MGALLRRPRGSEHDDRAYVALKVLGVDPNLAQMHRALAVVRRLGGLAEARVFTKIWMALFGTYPWAGVPTMPPEISDFPPPMPFNLYDFACWARGTVSAALRGDRALPFAISVSTFRRSSIPVRTRACTLCPAAGWLWWVDKALKAYETLPFKPGRDAACRKMIEWVIERQEADGSWGGIQPPWAYSLIALSISSTPDRIR